MGDRTKLKTLLRKAKLAIDSINLKYKNCHDKASFSESQLLNALAKNKELLTTLEIIQRQRSNIERPDVKKLLCRIKCNDVGYTLIENKNSDCQWFQDSMIINIQEQMNSEWKPLKQINYNTIFSQQKQTEDNLQACMQ